MENEQPLEQAPEALSIAPGAPDNAPPAPAPEVKGYVDKSASRREVIEKAVKNASEKRDGQAPAETAHAGKTVPAPSTNAAGRKIDAASGRYIKADGSLGEQAQPAKVREYPKSWAPELKPIWDKADQKLLDQIEKREADIFKGIEEYKKQAMPADLKALLSPYEQVFTQQYGGMTQGVSRLLEISNFAASKPQEFIQWFAQSKGINLGQAQADPNAPAVDPVVSALQAQVAELKQSLGSVQQQSQQAAMTPYLNEIERFKGEPGHEKFDELRTTMLAFIQSGSANSLQDAYEKAYRASFPDEWLSAQMAQRQKAEQERAQQARASAVQVTGAPSQASPRPVDPKNRRAVIEAAIRNAPGR